MVLCATILLAGCLPEGSEPAGQAPAETPPNSAPSISGTPMTSALAGSAWQFQPGATDADGDVLTFTAAGLPDWASFNQQTGLVSGTPTESHVGSSGSIVITVSDGEASASLPAFTILVATAVPPPPPPPPPPVNTRPVISGSPALAVQATTPYVFTPSASDAETPQGLVFSILNKPNWASFSTTTGRLAGTPAASLAGTVHSSIVISVTDGALTTALAPFAISVTAAPNRAPAISGTPSSGVTVGTAYSFQPTATDPDGQILSYTISNKPSWASFNSVSGRLSGTPGDTHVGTTSNIVISVSDGTLSASLTAFSVTVNARPNRAPTISGAPTTTATVGTSYAFSPAASDPDGDSLTWSISGKPAGAAFSVATGALTWTPTAAGTWANIVITVTDSKGSAASLPAFVIAVAAPAPQGMAALAWSAPTQYTDGSAMPAGDLAGFRIYHGTSATQLSRVAEVDGLTTTFTVRNLAAGAHYFAVTTVAASGIESTFSGVGSKTIP
jgi:hypothetical protein